MLILQFQPSPLPLFEIDPEQHEFKDSLYEVAKHTALEWVHNWSGWARIIKRAEPTDRIDPDNCGHYAFNGYAPRQGEAEVFACTHDPQECPICRRCKTVSVFNRPLSMHV